MSDLDNLEKKLKRDVSLSNDYLKKASKIAEAVPSMQRWKDRKETSLKIVQGLPKEVAEELAPSLLTWEDENDKAIKLHLPVLPDTSQLFINAVDSSSGSITPYIVNATNTIFAYESSVDENTDWIAGVKETITQHTLMIQQEGYLPSRLQKINNNLGTMYKIANDSVLKSQNNIIGIDQSAIQMRNVLEQVWGGLVDIARKKNSNPTINMKYLEMKKLGDRELVATLLSTNLFPKLKILELLSKLYDLHQKLSDRQFGKNILARNLPRLISYHNQWITLLDDISGLVI